MAVIRPTEGVVLKEDHPHVFVSSVDDTCLKSAARMFCSRNTYWIGIDPRFFTTCNFS